MKSKIAILLILVFSLFVNYAHAGYTIFTQPQVTPQYIVVHGVNGTTESRLNPGAPVTTPAGTFIYQPPNFSRYSTATANRKQLWETTDGAELGANILATFAIKDKIKADVFQIRKEALAKITTDNAGVLAIYDANFEAATAVLAGTGDTTIAKDGRTATAYLTAFGARLGMTATQFANWLITENQRVGALAARVEDEYLRLYYTAIPAETSVPALLSLPSQFRGFCGL